MFIAVDPRNGFKQPFCIRMLRLIKYFFNTASFNDGTRIHYCNLITYIRYNSKVMGYKYYRHIVRQEHGGRSLSKLTKARDGKGKTT